MNKVIDITLDDFSKEFIEAKIINNKEQLRSEYYEIICNAIKKNINISQRVYDSIPDLHYWIYKHFEGIGYKVVELDWKVKSGYFETISNLKEI